MDGRLADRLLILGPWRRFKRRMTQTEFPVSQIRLRRSELAREKKSSAVLRLNPINLLPSEELRLRLRRPKVFADYTTEPRGGGEQYCRRWTAS
jgi:hypothetical protein